jgi:hypothetical protein
MLTSYVLSQKRLWRTCCFQHINQNCMPTNIRSCLASCKQPGIVTGAEAHVELLVDGPLPLLARCLSPDMHCAGTGRHAFWACAHGIPSTYGCGCQLAGLCFISTPP